MLTADNVQIPTNAYNLTCWQVMLQARAVVCFDCAEAVWMSVVQLLT